jgi:PAS domain S-box-containing protein
MSLGAISRPVGAAIQALLNVDRFIGIAYLIDGKLYGTSMLAMNQGQPDPPQPILESFSYLASVSLRRKQAVRQREAALASLRESERKYRVLVENINDVLYTLDAAGMFTYVSPVIERLSGRKPDELLGRNFADFVHPDDLPLLIDKFRQTMGGARESFEFRVLNGEEIRHVRTSSQRVLREGVVTGLTGIMSDISQRKQEGELLHASEERYRQLVGNTDTGLVVIDDKGIVISANEPYLRLAGAERLEDVVGHSVTEWTAPDERENNARAVRWPGIHPGL